MNCGAFSNKQNFLRENCGVYNTSIGRFFKEELLPFHTKFSEDNPSTR
uniref:Uncharacterized protein n=1 Tax=Rhizophora mucronata TaxID=61149 RepID=A0A2P2Q3C1_RHIMU